MAWKDGEVFLLNVANNFGYIYNALRDIIFYIIGDRRTVAKDEYGIAVLLG